MSSSHRLWLGPDYLLSVRATGYSEEYKRFYFRDIQAIVLRGSTGGKNWSLGFLTVAGLVGFISVLASDGFALAAGLTLSGAFLVLLLIHLARGPTCVCHILTAVQMERLPALSRVRLARSVMDRIRPMIEQAQAAGAPAAAATATTSSATAPAPAPGPVSAPAPAADAPSAGSGPAGDAGSAR